jgi:hypothetical protein
MLDISDVLSAAQGVFRQPQNPGQRHAMAANLRAHASDSRVSDPQRAEAIALAVLLST